MRASIDLTAFVLAGGQSRRFQSDKAMQEWQGQPLLNHIIEQLQPMFENITVVGKSELPDIHADCGPLGGIHTGLHHTQTDWNFFVACDMPFINRAIIAQLIEHRNSNVLAVVPEVEGWAVPTFALYHRNAMDSIEQQLQQKKLSPQSWLKTIPTRKISEDQLRQLDPDLQSFININTLEDRKRALRLLRNL